MNLPVEHQHFSWSPKSKCFCVLHFILSSFKFKTGFFFVEHQKGVFINPYTSKQLKSEGIWTPKNMPKKYIFSTGMTDWKLSAELKKKNGHFGSPLGPLVFIQTAPKAFQIWTITSTGGSNNVGFPWGRMDDLWYISIYLPINRGIFSYIYLYLWYIWIYGIFRG